MGFLKRITDLFSSDKASGDEDKGVYVYIKIRRSGEIVKLRLMPGYDISQDDNGYMFARKMVMGRRSFEQVEAELYFNNQYQLVNSELSGGEVSDEASYLAQNASEE